MPPYLQEYEKVMSCRDALKMLLGDSRLTIRFPPWPLFFPNSSKYHGSVISIEGTDGQVYSGFAVRTAEDGTSLDEGQNKVTLTFGFGENQPKKPLEDRVFEFGFSSKRK